MTDQEIDRLFAQAEARTITTDAAIDARDDVIRDLRKQLRAAEKELAEFKAAKHLTIQMAMQAKQALPEHPDKSCDHLLGRAEHAVAEIARLRADSASLRNSLAFATALNRGNTQ